MGILGHSKGQAFTADEKNGHLELDSKRLLLRFHTGTMRRVVVPVAQLRGYSLQQDGKVILQAAGHKNGYTKDTLLPVITGFSYPEDANKALTELYNLDLYVDTGAENYRVRFINTRTPVKSLTYSDGVLEAERAILLLDGLLDEE